MNNFSEFPGYLGITSKGIIGIHADWPVYPDDHGWELALLSLGYHPRKTIFDQIDDIDRCILLLARDISTKNDPYHEDNFHVAIWHEDLVELSSLGYVTGVTAMTGYEWECNRFNQLPEGAGVMLNGKFVPIPPPTSPDSDDEDYDDSLSWVVVEDSGLVITDEGYAALHKLLLEEKNNLNPRLMAVVQPLIDIGKYDSAIRDGCVLIEAQLKEIVKTNAYGEKLVNQFFSKLYPSKKIYPRKIKSFSVRSKNRL